MGIGVRVATKTRRFAGLIPATDKHFFTICALPFAFISVKSETDLPSAITGLNGIA